MAESRAAELAIELEVKGAKLARNKPLLLNEGGEATKAGMI